MKRRSISDSHWGKRRRYSSTSGCGPYWRRRRISSRTTSSAACGSAARSAALASRSSARGCSPRRQPAARSSARRAARANAFSSAEPGSTARDASLAFDPLSWTVTTDSMSFVPPKARLQRTARRSFHDGPGGCFRRLAAPPPDLKRHSCEKEAGQPRPQLGQPRQPGGQSTRSGRHPSHQVRQTPREPLQTNRLEASGQSGRLWGQTRVALVGGSTTWLDRRRRVRIGAAVGLTNARGLEDKGLVRVQPQCDAPIDRGVGLSDDGRLDRTGAGYRRRSSERSRGRRAVGFNHDSSNNGTTRVGRRDGRRIAERGRRLASRQVGGRRRTRAGAAQSTVLRSRGRWCNRGGTAGRVRRLFGAGDRAARAALLGTRRRAVHSAGRLSGVRHSGRGGPADSLRIQVGKVGRRCRRPRRGRDKADIQSNVIGVKEDKVRAHIQVKAGSRRGRRSRRADYISDAVHHGPDDVLHRRRHRRK